MRREHEILSGPLEKGGRGATATLDFSRIGSKTCGNKKYSIVCLFVQGLDCSIVSRIESVFAEFPWVLMGHESIEWSEPTFTELRTPPQS